MRKFSKFVLIIVAAFYLLNTFSFFVFAQDEFDDLEITYPNLTVYVNAPESTRTYLPNYIRYIYVFAVFASGFVAFACILIGGLRFLTSVGNPGVMQDARDQMFSGIIGMLVIFGSYLILKELNPDLTSFSLPEIRTLTKGIILYSDSNCGEGKGNGEPYKAAILAEKNIQYKRIGDTKTNLSPEEDKDLWTINSFWSYHNRKDLDVTFYKNKDCSSGGEIESPVNKNDYQLNTGCCDSNGCGSGGGSPLGLEKVQCIKLVWRSPGVWLFNYPDGNPLNPKGAEGVEYVNYKTSQDSIKDKISDKIQSIALAKSSSETSESEEYYGAVIHNTPVGGGDGGSRGWAEILLPVKGFDITVYNLSSRKHAPNLESGVQSITIFRIPKNGGADESDEITLFRETARKLSGTENGTVVPQLNIKWQPANVLKGTAPTPPTDLYLEDLTQNLCKDAKVRNINEAMNDADSSNWDSPKDGCGEAKEYINVVGGVKILGATWKDELDREIKYKGNPSLKVETEIGVSGIFMPSDEKYMALLYEKSREPGNLARNGYDEWVNACIIYGSYSDLKTTSWENKLRTLVVIREKY